MSFFNTKFVETDTDTFLIPKIFETDTDTIKTIGKVSKPRSFETEMSISASHYDFHTGFLELTHGVEPALKLRDS